MVLKSSLMTPESTLIAYLFAKGEPTSRKAISTYLKLSDTETASAIAEASRKLEGTGLCLVDDGREIDLRTDESASAMVEQMRKEEFARNLGKAGLETLAILLYKGPCSRSEIDYIRGVNSTYTLRALSMRGLVRRIPNPKDERGFVYEPTIELLSHLGVASVSHLPDYAEVKVKIAELESEVEKVTASAEAKDAEADSIHHD